MSDKATLTQKQADALMAALDGYKVNEVVREQLIRSHFTGWKIPQYQALNEIDLDTLIRALYIGYEVEQTPEDKVREIFSQLYSDSKFQVRQILDILGIKISGVNAE